MHIKELIDHYPSAQYVNNNSAPDWMLGCFKRKSITFANGQTDNNTQVFWLQGRHQTIDLRLPIESELITTPWQECSTDELIALADYEGWSANSHWDNEQLSWYGGTSFQCHNRWPEPAILSRTGDCMMEFSPNGSYVEDWRINATHPGPLISLQLIEETNLSTGELRHQGGALIIAGQWAGLVLGRSQPLLFNDKEYQLRDMVEKEKNNPHFLEQVFNCETSIAQGNLDSGFIVGYSTQPSTLNTPIIALDGFEIDVENNEIIQRFNEKEQSFKRRFSIDTIEPRILFSASTPWEKDSEQWFQREQKTLGRYLE